MVKRWLLALAVLAGCSSGDDKAQPTIASLEDQTTLAASTTRPRPSFEQAAFDVVACMRDEGVDVPDPQFDAAGRFVVPTNINLADPKLRPALQKCSPLLAVAFPDVSNLDPDYLARVQDSLQNYADCMRTQGVEDFPNPQFVGGLPTLDLLGKIPFDDSDFREADAACRPQLDALDESP